MTYIVAKLTYDKWGNIRLDERSTEAIPIEWIINYIEENYYYDSVIGRMVEDWKKENEAN